MKILIVDDSPVDAEVTEAELRRSDLDPEFATVRDESELRHAMSTFEADIVLCDFSFPQFDGLEAVAVIREYHPELPVIFVSGTISEERAVVALQCGAVDYVLKSNLTRLPTAVRRAVLEARERKRLRGSVMVAELQRARQSERLDVLWKIANAPDLHGDELLYAMLCEAASALDSPQPFGGILTRSEGSDVVVLVTTPEDEDGRGRVPEAGTRLPLSSTLVPRGGRTQMWDIVTAPADQPAASAKYGWRCAITTTFAVGTARYHLTFASLEAPTRPFSGKTIEYVELLGAAFATRMRLAQLESALRNSEELSTFRLRRLERLYRLSIDPAFPGHDAATTLLQEASVAIRAGKIFRSALNRIEHGTLVAEFVVEPDDWQTEDDFTPDAAQLAEIRATGTGTYPNDARGLLVHAFTAGTTTYVLAFSHTDPLHEPFGDNDMLYVHVLGTLFARFLPAR